MAVQITRLCRRFSSLKRRFLAETAAVAAVEFAIMFPVFITLGLVGTEIAYMSTVNMRVSQIALSLADNASRIGQTDNSSVSPNVKESDIDSIMAGALKQGESFDLKHNGRLILSSLELDSATGKQYIRWQRCSGDLARTSTYGNDTDNNGLTGSPIDGVGQSSDKIRASTDSAVMIAEVYYDYKGLFGNLLPTKPTFRQEAIFTVRDDRNLTPGVTGTGGQSLCK
ncbi:MAG: TadE/TadG family type IV pilus assembly protein [Tsuneonella suprasediminis]|uniref:TadE/TadG family type IV pilus assembly protein n=1 Tax=Tsuneonella suprasediminis TaxID=2306996 RepID=UPI001F0BAD59|nr:pilus assembly protein TadE [Tsuneonella suprasediminis]